ncbi:uncharacterized protein LOC121391900 [Gigantopelta aegis]|uniref:uncharacterized protein LOC121391900 n=1 Tax=Gigantopelta aegis TaxID=1735272 RepID=UPI001B88E45C|nr:uncharacterized protein LOC121391900 [Gigantopelta aegis]
MSPCTAICERMFSNMNLVKTNHRTVLNQETLENTLTIMTHGPKTLRDFCPRVAIREWPSRIQSAQDMASSFLGSSEDRVSCPLCISVYKDPRNLPCGHTFCSNCLQSHISASISPDKTFRCPMCMLSINIPDNKKEANRWATQFPLNVALTDAIDEVKQLKRCDVLSAQKRPLKNTLQLVCKTLRSFCGILEDNIKNEVDRLQSGLAVSAAEVSADIDWRGAEIIQKLTETVRTEQNRLKKYLETSVAATNNDIHTIFTKDKHLLQKAKENLKLGENLIKSGSDSDIKRNLSKLQKIALEISQTNPKTEIPELKITLTDSKKKNTETFSVDIGEILKPDIKSLTDRLTLTDTRTDRQTDRLTLTQTFHTKISSDKLDPCLRSIAVLGGERSKKIVVSDRDNSCVKYFSAENFELFIKYDLRCKPCGLARSRDQQVVVVLPLKRQILYLDIQDDIRLTNTLNTEKQYWFISVLPSNHLAVSEWGGLLGFLFGECVDILDEGGHVIQSLPNHLIPCPSRLTVKGDSLVVVSKGNSLKCVTSSGRVTWQSRDSARLRHLFGVACDMEEFVYVCDDQRDCIVQLSRDGEVIRDVITGQDGLSGPESVCCDQDKLYVADEDGHVKIFRWLTANP